MIAGDASASVGISVESCSCGLTQIEAGRLAGGAHFVQHLGERVTDHLALTSQSVDATDDDGEQFDVVEQRVQRRGGLRFAQPIDQPIDFCLVAYDSSVLSHAQVPFPVAALPPSVHYSPGFADASIDFSLGDP